MIPVTETVFWISLSIVFYTYAGYPLILFILVQMKRLFVNKTEAILDNYPAVTMVVAAYNEEDVIESKIVNTLSLRYPKEQLTLLFITDGSHDRSQEVIKRYPSLVHLHQDERKGKLAAMNRAMEFVKTDYVIFSDANALLNPESVELIMRHYTDPKVGGVAGEKKIISAATGVAHGEGMYWKYESLLKKLDSTLNTVVGAAGELFSLRSRLYTRLPEDIIIEDFVQSLVICGKGYAIRYEPRAYSIEAASASERDEMERKIRITAGGFQAIGYLRSLLNIFRYPLLSFQYISHRILRWTLCPLALVAVFITSLILSIRGTQDIYSWLTAVQILFYLAAFAGWLRAKRGGSAGIFYLPFYFVFMNFCVFAGFRRYLAGSQTAVWQKADRKQKNNV